jgi:CheY-like chemotaxis protein
MQLVARMLDANGCNVLTARSGKEALEVFAVDPERVDLVMCWTWACRARES